MKFEVHESLAGNCPECKRLWDEAESAKAERDRLARLNDDLRGDNQAHFLKINELQKEVSNLQSRLHYMDTRFAVAFETLEKIEDVASAFTYAEGRGVSFRDFELRAIARETLAKLKGE